MYQAAILLFFGCFLITVQCLPSPSPVSIDDWAPVTDRKDLTAKPSAVTPNTQIKEPVVETTSQKNDLEQGRRRNTFGRRGNKKNSYTDLIIPTFIFPMAIFASFLPFLIPVLKMATLFAGVINNAALVAGILFLAKQSALEQEQKQMYHFNPGYLRRRTAFYG